MLQHLESARGTNFCGGGMRATPAPRAAPRPGRRGLALGGAGALVWGPARALAAGEAAAGGPAEARLRELTAGAETSVYTSTAEVERAVDAFVAEYGGRGAEDSFALGEGTWEVFHAPHIRRLSSTLGTQFAPLRYRLAEGGKISSFVRYENALGEGWLSAAGTLEAEDPETLRLVFDTFWVDGAGGAEEDLRQDIAGHETREDRIVTALGRAGFLPQFARFPVLAVSRDLAVFRFPPLSR